MTRVQDPNPAQHRACQPHTHCFPRFLASRSYCGFSGEHPLCQLDIFWVSSWPSLVSFQHLSLSSVSQIPEGTSFHTSDHGEQSCASRENKAICSQEKGVQFEGFLPSAPSGSKASILGDAGKSGRFWNGLTWDTRESSLLPTGPVREAGPYSPVILTEV